MRDRLNTPYAVVFGEAFSVNLDWVDSSGSPIYSGAHTPILVVEDRCGNVMFQSTTNIGSIMLGQIYMSATAEQSAMLIDTFYDYRVSLVDASGNSQTLLAGPLITTTV
jgi:hypothetical protein